MHESVMSFVYNVVNQFGIQGKSVLEVGSYDVNGTVRPIFESRGCTYLGVDIASGKGVDMIMDAHDLDFTDGQFDVVISCETLEHDSEFWFSLREMGRVLKKDGILILTARGNGFQYHPFPKDYWRFMPDSIEMWSHLSNTIAKVAQQDPQVSGLFYVGIKV